MRIVKCEMSSSLNVMDFITAKVPVKRKSSNLVNQTKQKLNKFSLKIMKIKGVINQNQNEFDLHLRLNHCPYIIRT